MTHHTLYSEFKLKNINLNNRYIVAPMTRISANQDGKANETMQKYYERYAKGGFSAIISEGIYLDESYSQGYENQPGLATEEHLNAWKPVVKAVQRHGSIMIAQLMHAGGQSQDNAYTNETISPSNIPPKGEQLGFYGGSGAFQTPKSMTITDIEQVTNSFVKSAVRAKKAGFNGVEIHGANGYLLDQFLTDYLNHRNDQYGGSKENRLKIFLEIIGSIREAVGSDFIVGIRISQIKVSDPDHKWAEGEKEAEYIFSELGKTSLDYIHVTDGDATSPSFGENSRTLAKAAKEFSNLPVIANGKLGNPDKAEELLKNNEADLISLGTSALANPDLPNRVRNNMELSEFDFEKILLPLAYVKDLELNMRIVQ
ncbi:NADH:flavin oxidoreductase [Filobacillus milosensis]|uniref:NADH:flavin oxidoreductase n=1 Tax=Filobacillus milosensis TaxID=94137 RepID=A0A4Y8IQY3_9BACI|nr:NADH:flavin oxidoreductase [Filobacillus milosensis]TFB24064.1 NADH:flavin oxidoreductase [Filobacillus milosensis]